MEGARQMMGNEVPVKVYIVQGKLYRTEFEFGGKTGYTIVTPTAGWSYIPMRSENVDAIPEDRLKGMLGQLDIAGPLVDYSAKGNKAVLIGKETQDKNDFYKVELTLPTGKKTTYYFDAKTGLLNRTSTMVPGMGANAAEREQVTEYSDYSPVDGIQFPHTISNPGAGQAAGSTTFDKIEVNKPVPENLYKPAK